MPQARRIRPDTLRYKVGGNEGTRAARRAQMRPPRVRGLVAPAPTDEPAYAPAPPYAPLDYSLKAVDLHLRLFADHAEVHCRLAIRPDRARGAQPLRLDGRGLHLRLVELDGAPLDAAEYEVTPDGLTLLRPPASGFVVTTTVHIDHVNNRQLSGLYRSAGLVLTQCEPTGFRRIAYYPDRPDVRPIWKVTIEAAAGLAMLSNGDEIARGACADDAGRAWVTFVDEVPKPSYLFAVVVGPLECTEVPFVTRPSLRRVALRAWTARGEAEHARLALRSLERALRFDEQSFGAEYEHSVYNVVGARDFNSGAALTCTCAPSRARCATPMCAFWPRCDGEHDAQRLQQPGLPVPRRDRHRRRLHARGLRCRP